MDKVAITQHPLNMRIAATIVSDQQVQDKLLSAGNRQGIFGFRASKMKGMT